MRFSDHFNENDNYDDNNNKVVTLVFMKPLVGAVIHVLLNIVSSYSHKNTIMLPILQMWRMRLRKVKSFTQGHMAIKWCSGDLSTVLPSA